MRRLAACLSLVLGCAAFASAQGVDAKDLYEKNCRKCHGQGQPLPAIKKLFPEIPAWDDAFFAKRKDADLIATITNGKGKNMKPWKDALTAEEIAAIASYIRTLRQ